MPAGDASDLGRVGVIGAGPAGLTAAYELARHGRVVDVFEGDGVVGGISRTVVRDRWRFDIGGHRFFTKVPEVEALWSELLAEDEFPVRPRMSRIYYRGRLFDYPLRVGNALRNLGFTEAARSVGSYAWTRIRPPADQTSFEGWVAARFGWRLYRTFFKTYTEKVWGVPATEIQADWAAQRIKDLSLLAALREAVGLGAKAGITTLIEQFRYPRLGPGMMWERARERVEGLGARVHLDTEVIRVEHHDGGPTAVVALSSNGERRVGVDAVVSSMPLGDLVRALDPPPPEPVLAAAAALRHRDFLTVALVIPASHAFPDNWIYVHDPTVRVGRIQNYAAWSPDLVAPGTSCLGLEYFVTEGDALWSADDEELIALATAELSGLGLVAHGAVSHGYVVRMPKAYPVYDQDYQANVAVIREWLQTHLPAVHPVGRNGMHRYNNADHSMITALLAARNILGASPAFDPWSVNVEGDYHEQSARGRSVSGRRPRSPAGGRGTGRAAPVTGRSGAETPNGPAPSQGLPASTPAASARVSSTGSRPPCRQAGTTVTAANAPRNGTLATGASTGFGTIGTWRSSSAPPATLRLNGHPCTTTVTTD